MDDNRLIQNLRTLPLYNAAMEKLTVAPTRLDENEKTFLLTVAIILLRKYERDNRLNRQRSKESKVIYLSPLVTDTNNLKTDESQEIFEQRIRFNIKEPELFEYCIDGTVQKYNRFTDTFFPVGHALWGRYKLVKKLKRMS